MHNAMWKLALWVRGIARLPLLDTYDTERREPSVRTAQQSLENHRNVGLVAAAARSPDEATIGPDEVIRTARRYGNHLGVELGAAYSSSAVLADGSAPPAVADDYSDYAPSATPGCRAPHLPLGDARLSTLDLFAAGFTLLAGRDGSEWKEAAHDTARRLGAPLAAYAIGAPGLAVERDEFLELYGIGDDGAVLVRPDGYVAWRAARAPEGDPRSELRGVLEQILHLNATHTIEEDR
jgi:hypothetical protein